MNNSQKKSAVAVGALTALAAAAAAGTYFFGGKGGAKNRKKATAWAEKAKKQIVAQLKAMEKVTKSSYNQAVDSVAKQYKELKNVDPKELQDLTKELKGHWDSITKEVSSAAKEVVKQAKHSLGVKPQKKPQAKTAKQPAKKPTKK